MNRTLAPLVLSALVVACSTEAPVAPHLPPSPPLSAKPVGQQTLYVYALGGGLQSDVANPFSALAPTGSPLSGNVSGDPVYLVLPESAGGDPAICDEDGSGQASSTDVWEGYAGTWKGALTVAPGKGRNSSYSVRFNATRTDGTGWLWLVVNGGVKINGNLVTFTSVRGLVSTYSTPTGSFDPRVGPFDDQDRCLTFSITATP